MKHYLKLFSKIQLIAVLLCSSTVTAEDADSVISRLQSSFKSIKNFEARFNQELINSAGEAVMKLSGIIFYEQPEKFNIDLGDKAIISNGINVYNVDENLGRVVISSADDRTNSFSLQKFIFDFPSLCTRKIVGIKGENTTIELVPKEELGFQKVDLQINDEYFISEINILDNASNQIIFKLSDYKLNTNIEPEIFEYNTQQGLEVIDLR